MLRIKIILHLLITACLLMALNANGQTGFNNYYQSGWRSMAGKCIEIDTNEFLVVGYFEDSLSGQQGLDLRRIDALGQTLQHKRHLFKDMDFLTFFNTKFLLNFSNSSMLLTAGSFSGTTSAIITVSINKTSLDTNWVTYYSDGPNYFLNNFMRISNNEFWLFGSKADTSINSLTRPFALKMDSMGNVVGKKEFIGLLDHSAYTSYYDMASNKLYFTGYSHTNPPFWQSYAACMDTTGNIYWFKPIGAQPVYFGFSQIELNNNYLVVSGQKWTKLQGSYNYYKLSLSKLDASNGNIIWQKNYGEDFIEVAFKAFTINNDESITAVGAYQFPSYNPIGLNTNGVILKANANGDSLWMHTYGNHGVGKVETFHDIQPTSDGGFIICGAPHYADPCHSWVVKTDSIGQGAGMYPVGFDEFLLQEDLTLKVYPNPAKNNIRFDKAYEEMYEVLVFNTLGQMIMHLKDYENNTSASIENLHSGLYTFIIRKEEKIHTGKFIKE